MIDVDGVLLTGRPKDGRSWQFNLLSDLGFNPRELDDYFFAPHWQDIVVGKSGIEPFLSGALKKMRSNVSAKQLMDYWFAMDSRIDDQILNFISEIRNAGLSVFLSTNQERRRAAHIMTSMGLKNYVDGIIYSGALGIKKPDPAFFARAMNITRFRPDEHLLIDDSPRNVASAVQIGWSAVQWTQNADLAKISRRHGLKY